MQSMWAVMDDVDQEDNEATGGGDQQDSGRRLHQRRARMGHSR